MRAAASCSRPLLWGVSDTRPEQSSEVRARIGSVDSSSVKVQVQWQESNGRREASRLALVGEALKVGSLRADAA
jgi:hypothetical protein